MLTTDYHIVSILRMEGVTLTPPLFGVRVCKGINLFFLIFKYFSLRGARMV
jgi:hypothetical protein